VIPTTTSTSSSTTTSTSSSTSSTTSTSTSTTSTTSTSLQVCDCDDLPFFAEVAAKLSSGTTVNADLGVNETSGVAILAPQATMANGTTLFADRVKLAAGSDVFDVRTNSLNAASVDSIHGTVGPVPLPLRAPFCQLPVQACGSGDIQVTGIITELTLPAGSYGRVTVGEGALLHLDDNAPYGFCELRIANGGEVLAKHQITIDVTGNVRVGTGSKLHTSGGAPLRLRVGGRKVLFGRDALITAALTAPDAKAKVKTLSVVHGCMCARVIKTAKGATLSCAGDASPSGAFLD